MSMSMSMSIPRPWKNWSYKPVGNSDDAAAETAAEVDAEAEAEAEDGAEADEKRQNPAASSFVAPAGSPPTTNHNNKSSSATLVSLTAAIPALVLLLLFVLMPRPWLRADHPDKVHDVGCGNSTADAAAAGCKFDVMAYAWVQPACFDQALMYEFLGRDAWAWHLDADDANSSSSLAVNDVAAGRHEFVYVTWRYYMAHCTYMWRKMHRSLLTSRQLDSYVADYRHTEQCERVLLDGDLDLDSVSVMLVAKYPSCPIVVK